MSWISLCKGEMSWVLSVFGYGEKMNQFYKGPKFGVEMWVCWWAIGLNIKMTKTSVILGCVGYVKQHITDHKQGLGFTRI